MTDVGEGDVAVDIEDRFVASMWGLALADAIGVKHEGGFIGQTIYKLTIGETQELRWSDDTQMSMGLARSLVECGGLDPDHLARHWAEELDPKRGYGPGARKLLQKIKKGGEWRELNTKLLPGGSFGNGAAMRAGPLGLFYHEDMPELVKATRLASSITHAHPLGIEGGLLIARSVALALIAAREGNFVVDDLLETLQDVTEHDEYLGRLETARNWLQEGHEPSRHEVRKELGMKIVAFESAVTAVYIFCRYHDGDFLEMVEYIISLGGDTDTVGAMAGSIWGALRGTADLPKEALDRLEAREELAELARGMYRSEQRPRAG